MRRTQIYSLKDIPEQYRGHEPKSPPQPRANDMLFLMLVFMLLFDD